MVNDNLLYLYFCFELPPPPQYVVDHYIHIVHNINTLWTEIGGILLLSLHFSGLQTLPEERIRHPTTSLIPVNFILRNRKSIRYSERPIRYIYYKQCNFVMTDYLFTRGTKV